MIVRIREEIIDGVNVDKMDEGDSTLSSVCAREHYSIWWWGNIDQRVQVAGKWISVGGRSGDSHEILFQFTSTAKEHTDSHQVPLGSSVDLDSEYLLRMHITTLMTERDSWRDPAYSPMRMRARACVNHALTTLVPHVGYRRPQPFSVELQPMLIVLDLRKLAIAKCYIYMIIIITAASILKVSLYRQLTIRPLQMRV